MHVCNEAPVDADIVRVSWRGELREVPVQNGIYLAAWWRERCPDRDWPWMTACRIDGHWVGAP